MITDYPILRYLSTKTGKYVSSDGRYEIELRKNHYDYVLISNTKERGSTFYGVVGVSDENLELHASVGLPNIIVFSWPHALEKVDGDLTIHFTENNLAARLEISLSFSEGSLKLSFIVNGKVCRAYILSKV
ncbi:hypothetical protein [Zooshikella ganghwensis]|uniref:Uncharacterized protein n=1 Tax=Zooshikella ganghwensis TaxID=202772 RepID=A0A4P9VMJ0_9GAMM|nr:hypothetical protein [Zooshikella ganghwensis]RDH44618.1 hypothetical protein B9G39_14900 [Zooshikella ganghwensis]